MKRIQDHAVIGAQFYARLGWMVFPIYEIEEGKCACEKAACSSPGKHPRIYNGFLDATTDKNTIEQWWDQWPRANVGVRTGRESGIVVVDIDPPKGGDDSWNDACNGQVPFDTVEVLTGGGGRHIYFQHPGGVVKSAVGVLPGIDIRGDGGYVVVPPSFHVSGSQYLWEDACRPGTVDVSPIPVWVANLIRPPSKDPTRRISCPLKPIPNLISQGERHTHLLSFAGSMRHRGATCDEVYDAIASLNSRRCRPPLSEPEIRALADDVTSRYMPGNTGLSKAKSSTINSDSRVQAEVGLLPFPVDVLPGPLKVFVKEGSEALRVPPDFIAVPMLSVLGTAVGTRRVLEIKGTWHEAPRIWTAVIAQPGSGKTPAQRLALKPVERFQIRLKNDFEAAVAQYEESMNRFKESGAANKNAQTRAEPYLAQIFTTNPTIEALTQLLQNNPDGILLYRDEISGWVRGMDQYKGGKKGSERQEWLSIWGGSPMVSNRVNKPAIVVENPFVCVTGGIPPEILSDLTDEQSREDGFVHRILCCYPDEMQRGWTDDDVSNETNDGYVNIFDALRHLPNRNQVVCFTELGKQAFVEYVDDHNRRQMQQVSDCLRGPYAKFDGYLARISLVIHLARFVCDEADSECVDDVSVRAAISIIDYFKSHAQRVYQRLYYSKADRCVQGVIDWMKRKEQTKVSARDLYINYRGHGCGNPQEAKALMALLSERDYGDLEETRLKNGLTTLSFTLHEDSPVISDA
jgi:hypothetical protein